MQSFIFDANKETPESLARRRALAQTMAQKVGTPRNVGEGLSALGAGIAGMVQNNRIKKTEQMGRESANAAFEPILAAMSGRQAQSASPQAFAAMGGSQAELPSMPMSGGNSPVPNAYANDRVAGAFDRDALHKAQLMAESGGDPNAVSPVGAIGLMQIMPETAKQPGFGLKPLENPLDPVANEQFGRQYMDKMLARYDGDPKRALAAYNWGAGNADKWDGDESKLPAETRNYIAKIMGAQQPQNAQSAISSYMPQQGGQPQQQQSGIGLPELMKAAQNPWLNDGQRSVLNAMMEQQFKAMAPQDPMKALQIQKLQKDLADDGKPWWVRDDGSVDPSYLASKKAGATNVVTNVGGNSSKFAEESDKAAAGRLNDIVATAQAAPELLGQVQQLADMSKAIGTGKGAEIMNTLGPYAQSLGIDVQGLDATQAFKSITSKLAPQMRPVGSGSSSDKDVAMFLESLPSLGNTPEGNQLIAGTFQAILQNRVKASEIASLAYRKPEDGGITWQEAEKRIRELPNPYEAFKKSGATSGTSLEDWYDIGDGIKIREKK